MIKAVGKVLNSGAAQGEAIRFDEPLSFWGGFDAERGMVIDRQHPQYGVVITGKILVMPGSRGSAGTPGVLAETLRLKTGPIGIILDKADINVATGAMIVSELYGQHCPVVSLARRDFEKLDSFASIHMHSTGIIEQS